MSGKLLTVVTVAYNAEDLIEETLKSVINQTAFDSIEYIVIDGASTDNTLAIIKKYSNKITTLVSEPDRGVYDAMNKATDLATGKWINFMNAGDTFVSLTVVEQCLHTINKKTDVLYGNHYYLDKGNKELRISEIKNIYSNIVLNHQSMLYKTSLLKKYKYNEAYKIVADCDLNLKLFSKGYNFQYINIPVANFLAGGLNAKYRTSTLIEFLFVLDTHIPKGKDITETFIYNAFIQEGNKRLGCNSSSKEDEPIAFTNLKNQLDSLSSVSFFKNPLLKIKKYKSLLSYYASIK